MTHICVSKLTIIGSDNDLSPDRRQAITWTNAGILLIGALGTNLNEIFIKMFIKKNAFEHVVCETVAILSRPQCVNSSPPGQNSRHFVNDIFEYILLMTGDKPFTKRMVTQFTDAYMQI